MSLADDIQQRLDTHLRRAGLQHIEPGVVRAALIVALGLVCLSVWRWWPAQDNNDSIGTERSFAADGRSASDDGQPGLAEPTSSVLVHVVGAVRRPGVYALTKGDRVKDAVDAAGGTLPDAVPEAVNMAREVEDGEQVAIPDEDQYQASAGSSGANASSGPLVDLNRADAAALDSLPGVGPATAAKIIAEREANGPFKSTEDLSRVPGIGEKRLAQLEGLICVR